MDINKLLKDERFIVELDKAIGSGSTSDWGYDGEDEFQYEIFEIDVSRKSIIELLSRVDKEGFPFNTKPVTLKIGGDTLTEIIKEQ